MTTALPVSSVDPVTQEPVDPRAPYGRCECVTGCQCQYIAGPAAFQIERGEKTMKVCTRCDLSTDRNKKCLVQLNDPIGPFLDYDALGAFAITMMAGGAG